MGTRTWRAQVSIQRNSARVLPLVRRLQLGFRMFGLDLGSGASVSLILPC